MSSRPQAEDYILLAPITITEVLDGEWDQINFAKTAQRQQTGVFGLTAISQQYRASMQELL